MTRPGWPLAAAAAALVSTVVALTWTAAVPAGASSAREAAARHTWQLVYQHRDVNIQAISATGPKDAWAIGTDKTGGLLLRWDGSAWRPVHYPDQRNYLPSQIFALSPTDVWLFGYDSTQPAEIMHWHNGFWDTPMSLPVNAQDVAVLSDSNIWVVGGTLPGCSSVSADSQGCTITSHWNGSTWTSYPLRAVEGVTFGGISGSDVWAVGDSFVRLIRDSPSFVPHVFRWTGSAWQRTSLVGRRSFWSPSIVVRSPRDVYVAESTKANRNACAMHWNGNRWTPFRLPGSPGECKWTISDYHRGLWFYGPPAGPGYTWEHWTGQRFVTTPRYVPSRNGWNTNGFILAAVPHSSSVWLFGSYCGVSPTCRIKGVIAALR